MRFGFDLDEVVVDLTSVMLDYIEINYGVRHTIQCFSDYDFNNCKFHDDDKLNLKIIKGLISVVVTPEFQYTAPPIMGARETLQKFKRNGHDLYFISSRPKENKDMTIKWLRDNDIPFDGIEVVGSDVKGVLGKKLKLDMYVDDLPKHLVSMQSYKKRWRKGLIVFDKPWNQNLVDCSRFIKLCNWKELMRHVGVANR